MDREQLRAFMAREIQAINRTFRAHGVRARAAARLTMPTPAYISYGLTIAPGQRVAAVLSLHRELAIALSTLRRRPARLRLQTLPLAIEAPHPEPRPLHWTGQPSPAGTLTLGVSFGYTGAHIERLDLATWPHVLIAGTTGSGKSNLLSVALAGLLLGEGPDNLQIIVVDLKNEDLAAFQAAPHCIAYAGDMDRAGRAIAWADSEKGRRIATGDRPGRLLIVIDELAELAGDAASMDRLAGLLSVGRSLGINVVAATQHPLAAVVGSIAKANFPARVVGATADANAARVAAGRSDSGAEFLPGQGAFLCIAGGDMRRFQAFYLPAGDVAGVVADIGARYPGRVAAVLDDTTRDDDENGDELDRLRVQAAPVFDEYFDPERGQLRRGGLSAIIRALYGPAAPTGGHYRAVALRVVEALKNTTTTPGPGLSSAQAGD